MSAVNAPNSVTAEHAKKADTRFLVMSMRLSARWKPALLGCWRRVSRGRREDSALRETSADTSDPAPLDDAAVRACGWFDSSHDLQQGLRVEEHLSPDSLVHELPLGAWLDLQLSHWRGTVPGTVPSGLTKAG